jgi:hypothetical protein
MSSKIQKVLIAGCSFSAANTQSGWREQNLHNTYHHMLQAQRDWKIHNCAIGGCSNKEITYRTIENCLSEHFDLCIIQWSSLHRLWFYEADLNIDDETQILPNVCGRITAGDVPKMIHESIIAHYLNDYMALKHWLYDQLMLQSFLNQRGIRYIFVKGFPNYVPELEILTQQWPQHCIPDLDIPDAIKCMLHFDINPDDFLYLKLARLIQAYSAIDKNHCIGYTQSSMIYGLHTILSRDYADDSKHPGRAVNTALSSAILEHLEHIS